MHYVLFQIDILITKNKFHPLSRGAKNESLGGCTTIKLWRIVEVGGVISHDYVIHQNSSQTLPHQGEARLGPLYTGLLPLCHLGATIEIVKTLRGRRNPESSVPV